MKAKILSGIQVICLPCPLISKLPTLNNPLARRCGEIIENARHIWGYYSPEEQSVYYEVIDGEEVPKKFPPYSNLKLTSARSIQSWYVEHSDLTLTNQKTPEAIKKAVQDVRRYARPSIESNITDKEILAIFAICEVYEAVDNIQLGKPEEAIKEKVLSASMFLNLAKAGFEPEKQTPASTPEVIPFPTPSGIQWDEVKISFIDNENVSINIKGAIIRKHYAEMGFRNKKTCKPVKSWVILRGFSEQECLTYAPSIKEKVEKNIQDLRKRLRACFGIQDDPIIFNHGYKPKFKVSKSESQGHSVYAFSNSDLFDEKEED